MSSEQKDLFNSQTGVGQSPGEAIFEAEIPGRLPSWNEILGMEQWARYKFKKQLAEAFLSGLRATGGGCLTKTISAKNSTSTYAATLESYLRTRQAKRKLKLAKKRLEAKRLSSSESKSTVPF